MYHPIFFLWQKQINAWIAVVHQGYYWLVGAKITSNLLVEVSSFFQCWIDSRAFQMQADDGANFDSWSINCIIIVTFILNLPFFFIASLPIFLLVLRWPLMMPRYWLQVLIHWLPTHSMKKRGRQSRLNWFLWLQMFALWQTHFVCQVVLQSVHLHHPQQPVDETIYIIGYRKNLTLKSKMVKLCIKASHTSLQRGMSKLYLETNRNTTLQIDCKLYSWSWCQKLSILNFPKINLCDQL